MFYISTKDEFGTISGFRLGRLPTTEVKWEEINAAIGQSVYLLCVLAHRFEYKIENFDIALCGAHSRIWPKQNAKVKFDLFMPGKEEQFSQGLVCLLAVLNDLQKFVGLNYAFERLHESLGGRQAAYDFARLEKHKTVFKIAGDCINGVSIRYNSNDLPAWTRACKYYLTNLQHLVYMSVVRDIIEAHHQF